MTAKISSQGLHRVDMAISVVIHPKDMKNDAMDKMAELYMLLCRSAVSDQLEKEQSRYGRTC